MNIRLFLEDLSNCCLINNINFSLLTRREQKLHIQKMCKLIAKQSHIKK